MSAQITTADLFTENKYQPWIVCFSAALFFFFELMQMTITNSMSSHLLKEFSLTADQMGTLSSNYFLGNIIFLFPAGIIIDRVSTRRLILITMALCVLGSFGFAMSPSYFWAATCRFIVGVGGAFCFLSNVRLASRWFPPERLALVIGFIVTMAMLGGAFAQTPFTLLADHMGWRNAFIVNACIGLIMLIVIFIFVRDYPKGQAQAYHKQHDALQTMGFFSTLKKALVNSQNWLGGIYTSFMNLPIMLLGAVWGTLYLVQVHNLSRAEASLGAVVLFAGSIIGSPFWGWLSDRLGIRKKPMIVAAFVSLVTILVIMFCPGLPLITTLALFFILGFFSIAQILSYPLIAESNPRALTATSESIASFLIQSGGFTQIIFGILMELNWNQTIVNGERIYSPENFLLAMSMLPIAFGIALIVAFRIRETYCKHIEE